jgi:hypothetical protein
MHATLWIKGLGYAGLLPFILLAIATGYTGSDWSLKPMSAYSFGILVFLLGSWWGIGLLRHNIPALCLSNGLFLIALVVFVWLPGKSWLAISSALFVTVYIVEGKLAAFTRQPVYYRRLRLHLTLGVAVTQLGLYIWLSTPV